MKNIVLQGIQRESRNVLDLMKQFRLEEEGQKSAINGDVENGEDPNSLLEEPTPEKETSVYEYLSCYLHKH